MELPYRDGRSPSAGGGIFISPGDEKGTRPEIDCCRICGYDLRDRPEDYLRCPECNAPNNRTMARRAGDPALHADGPIAWRFWLPAVAVGLLTFFPGVLAVSWIAHRLTLPSTPLARIAGSMLLVVMPTVLFTARARTPAAFRGGLGRWPFYLWTSFILSAGIAIIGLVIMFFDPRL